MNTLKKAIWGRYGALPWYLETATRELEARAVRSCPVPPVQNLATSASPLRLAFVSAYRPADAALKACEIISDSYGSDVEGRDFDVVPYNPIGKRIGALQLLADNNITLHTSRENLPGDPIRAVFYNYGPARRILILQRNPDDFDSYSVFVREMMRILKNKKVIKMPGIVFLAEDPQTGKLLENRLVPKGGVRGDEISAPGWSDPAFETSEMPNPAP